MRIRSYLAAAIAAAGLLAPASASAAAHRPKLVGGTPVTSAGDAIGVLEPRTQVIDDYALGTPPCIVALISADTVVTGCPTGSLAAVRVRLGSTDLTSHDGVVRDVDDVRAGATGLWYYHLAQPVAATPLPLVDAAPGTSGSVIALGTQDVLRSPYADARAVEDVASIEPPSTCTRYWGATLDPDTTRWVCVLPTTPGAYLCNEWTGVVVTPAGLVGALGGESEACRLGLPGVFTSAAQIRDDLAHPAGTYRIGSIVAPARSQAFALTTVDFDGMTFPIALRVHLAASDASLRCLADTTGATTTTWAAFRSVRSASPYVREVGPLVAAIRATPLASGPRYRPAREAWGRYVDCIVDDAASTTFALEPVLAQPADRGRPTVRLGTSRHGTRFLATATYVDRASATSGISGMRRLALTLTVQRCRADRCRVVGTAGAAATDEDTYAMLVRRLTPPVRRLLGDRPHSIVTTGADGRPVEQRLVQAAAVEVLPRQLAPVPGTTLRLVAHTHNPAYDPNGSITGDTAMLRLAHPIAGIAPLHIATPAEAAEGHDDPAGGAPPRHGELPHADVVR